MKKIFFLLVVAICVSCGDDDNNDGTPVPATSKPNILLIIADDMGIDATPGYDQIGTIKPNMPHLTALQSSGLTFDNAWSYPICASTRSTILTGKYGVETGVLNLDTPISPSEKTLQTYLDEELNDAYAHSIIGKWHLGTGVSHPTNMGVGYYAGLLSGAVQDYNSWRFTLEQSNTLVDSYITEAFTDLAIDWINDQDKPWFCWLAYTAPHTPFHVPPTGTHSQGNLSDDPAAIAANPTPYFMAMMENLDFEIGRLMDNIPSEELDNTIILFIGDNGTHGPVIQAPYQTNRSKGSIHEGGIHVPLIVSGKGVSRMGQRDASLVSSVDLFATIADLAGINSNSYESSISFEPLLTTSTNHTRTYNYSEILNENQPANGGHTIRNATYKLLRLDNNTERMYNLVVDPFEQDNLLNGNAGLSDVEQAAYNELVLELDRIRN